MYRKLNQMVPEGDVWQQYLSKVMLLRNIGYNLYHADLQSEYKMTINKRLPHTQE